MENLNFIQELDDIRKDTLSSVQAAIKYITGYPVYHRNRIIILQNLSKMKKALEDLDLSTVSDTTEADRTKISFSNISNYTRKLKSSA